MDLNIQIFTGGCNSPANLEDGRAAEKLRGIIKKRCINNGFIGWNTGADISEIINILKDNGAGVYLWLPVFSELDALAGFHPIVSADGSELLAYDRGNGEAFNFCCPANPENVDIVIDIYEKHYNRAEYDGVFIDKIRFPSFAGGLGAFFSCYCGYCKKHFDLPDPEKLYGFDAQNPLGLIKYKDLDYIMDDEYRKLISYKSEAVYLSLKRLCDYFRGCGLKIGFDLFSPFLAPFTGQDYRKLLPLADFIKPMFYKLTDAPAGLPFEIGAYASAFGGEADDIKKRAKHLKGITGYDGAGFIRSETAGILKLIKNLKLQTKLYAGIEINYSGISPVTFEYIEQSVENILPADGITASWDLNTTPVSHIDCLLRALDGDTDAAALAALTLLL